MSVAALLAAALLAAVSAAASCLAVLSAEGGERLRALSKRLRGRVASGGATRVVRGARNDAHRWWEARLAGHSRREVRAACLDEMPELLDVLALGLSAGISFDASLSVYCERYDTMLAARMGDAMRSWQLGLSSRHDALSGLAEELGVDAFTSFVSTVGESLALGAPLAQTLTAQAEAVREARRADQQEAVEKAPVKMLVPIGTLILPAMLLAILGPLFASLASGS